MGIEGMSRSEVSRLAAELDALVAEFRDRPLDTGPYRYLWVDALTQRGRAAGRVVNVSAVIAHRSERGGTPRDHRVGHRHHRGHRELDRVPPGPGSQGAVGGGAGDFRRPRWDQSG